MLLTFLTASLQASSGHSYQDSPICRGVLAVFRGECPNHKDREYGPLIALIRPTLFPARPTHGIVTRERENHSHLLNSI